MDKKPKKKHSKKWAIYCWNWLGPYYIGKITERDKEHFTIQYYEWPETESGDWNGNVIPFYNPLKAIDFFLSQGFDRDNSKIYSLRKKFLIDSFLSDFPSEEKNIERLLKLEQSQSSPKYTYPRKNSNSYQN